MPKVGIKPVRQAQLIEATMESVALYGLQGTTITTISKLAGVSSGIISHYFGGKQELLEATVRYLLQSLQRELLDKLELVERSDPLRRLEAIIEANFSHLQVSDQAAKTWLAFWVQATHDPVFGRLQNVNEKRLLANLRYSLNGLVEQGRLPKERVAGCAQSIAALIDGFWLRGALHSKPINADQAISHCKQYISDLVCPVSTTY